MDLIRAYHQIPIETCDIPKTAISSPFGLFEFCRMTFGLRNAAQSFQRLMHSVLAGLPFCFVYLDDLLIASRTFEEHLIHLEKVFQRLSEYGLVINLNKCVFAKSEVNFLGHSVNARGILPSCERIQAISQFERPQTVQQLKRFLGMLNFYRRFIPSAAHDQMLLNDYLKGYRKNSKQPVNWSEASIAAFENCKTKLCKATILSHPSLSASLAVMVDASDLAIGGVVQQFSDDSWQPLAFFSIRLNDAQQRYSAYDRELLAAYSSIKHFRFLLEGRNFTLYTDHKPLIYAFKQKSEKASPRQARHLDYIGQFTTDIRHISGADNVVADTLSRIDQISVPESIDYTHVADEQANDEELQALLERGDTALNLQQVPITFNSDKLIYCDTSTGKSRPFIPRTCRKKVFEAFHNLSHPGVRASIRILTQNVVWPSIRKDTKSMAQSCVACQKSKVTRHTKSPTSNFEATASRFTEVHLDIIGPLPPSENQRYCITLIDRFTRWAEAIPVSDITAATVAFAVYSTWISRFGVPRFIVTDQGSQFESQLFAELASLVGFERRRTTSYNPKCNGMVERWHRTLKAAIMCHNLPNWTYALPTILLGLRTTFSEELQTTPAELVYGDSIRVPGQFLETNNQVIPQSELVKTLKEHMSQLRPCAATHHSTDKVFISQDLKSCSHVFVRTDALRKALQPPYTGPHVVVQRHEKFFDIELNGKQSRISVDRLKPCHIENEIANDPSHSSQEVLPPKPNPAIQKPEKQVTFNLGPSHRSDKTITRAGRVTTLPWKLR